MGATSGRRRVGVFLMPVALVAAVACSAEPAPVSVAAVAVVEVAVPVREPVWYHDGAVLFGIAGDGGRVVRIDPDRPAGSARTMVSEPLDVGENLVVGSAARDAVYVPQPDLGRVIMLDTRGLRPLGMVAAGREPSYLALDVGSRMLLALAADGSAVTGVRLRGLTPVPPQGVHAGAEAEIDGPERGRPVDYHVVGPQGVVHYKGQADSVHAEGTIDVPVHESAGDPVKVSRLYVAEAGSDRLLAVETTPEHRLVVSAEAHLGEPVKYVGADEHRVYAVTATRLVVFEANTFTGFPLEQFTTVERIDYRATLPGALATASLSGFTVGDEDVYLSLEGEPYLVRIRKPEL